LYQELEVPSYPVKGPAEPTADAVESVEEVAERVQTSKQAQEIAASVRDIVQPIEPQVECPPKTVVQAIALPAAAQLVNTTIQPTNEVINTAELPLQPIGGNTEDVENILQPVPQIPELAESLLLSVETVPNFFDDNLQDTSRFTQEPSEISRSGSISMLAWDNDDAITSTKDLLQLPSIHPSMTDDIDFSVSVEAVSPIFPGSALPSNDGQCNEAQNSTLEDNSNKAIRLAEDQDIATVYLDQGPHTLRILTSGVDTNDMVVSDDLSLTLDPHSPHMLGPSALPDAASSTPSTEAFDIEPDPLEPVGYTPPLSLPNDTAMTAPLPTVHMDNGSAGASESSVVRKKRRRPTVWERMAKKKAKALLMQAPVVEVSIPVFSMDDENCRPLTALERMAKRHARQVQASAADLPIPVLGVGDEKKALIKAAVLEANSMISNAVHPSSRGISGFEGSSTSLVPLDEDKKARIKAAVLEANMMICGASHPRLIGTTDSDSGKSLPVSNNSDANKEARINTARLKVNKVTNGHSSNYESVPPIAPILRPVVPDCSNFTTDNSLAHAKYISSSSQSNQDPHLELEAVSSTSTTLKKTVLGVQSDFVADAKALHPVKSMVDPIPPVVTSSVALVAPAMNAAVVQLPVQLPRNDDKNMKRSSLKSTQQRSLTISSAPNTYRSTTTQSHVLQPTSNIYGRRNHVKQQASRYKDNKTIPTFVASVKRPSKNLSHLASKLHTPIPGSTAHGKRGASTSSFSLTNQRSENLPTDRNLSSSRWAPQNGR
jgi:hypothetical protein